MAEIWSVDDAARTGELSCRDDRVCRRVQGGLAVTMVVPAAKRRLTLQAVQRNEWEDARGYPPVFAIDLRC